MGIIKRGAVLAAGVAVAAASLLGAKADAAEIAWRHSYGQAAKEAGAQHKLLMVDFYTDWCGVCKQMDATTYRDSRILQRANAVVPVKLNAEKEGAALARKHAITGYPTILFIQPNGEVVGRVLGGRSAADFARLMDDTRTYGPQYRSLLQQTVSRPKDATALAKLALAHGLRGNRSQASIVADRALRLDPRNGSGLLSRAFSLIGDLAMMDEKTPPALAAYRKAARTARTGAERAGANLNVGMLLAMQGQKSQAATTLKQVAAEPTAPADTRRQAKGMLEAMKRQ